MQQDGRPSLVASSSSGSGGVERGKGYEQTAALAL